MSEGLLTFSLLVSSMGNARFLKSVVVSHPQGRFLCKIYLKMNDESLGRELQRLEQERNHLQGIPNILPYEMVIETDRAGYAIRQFIHGSLYDRIRFFGSFSLLVLVHSCPILKNDGLPFRYCMPCKNFIQDQDTTGISRLKTYW
jgi:hypothetical protein